MYFMCACSAWIIVVVAIVVVDRTSIRRLVKCRNKWWNWFIQRNVNSWPVDAYFVSSIDKVVWFTHHDLGYSRLRLTVGLLIISHAWAYMLTVCIWGVFKNKICKQFQIDCIKFWTYRRSHDIKYYVSATVWKQAVLVSIFVWLPKL